MRLKAKMEVWPRLMLLVGYVLEIQNCRSIIESKVKIGVISDKSRMIEAVLLTKIFMLDASIDLN